MNKKFTWLSALVLALLLGQPSFASSNDQATSGSHHHWGKVYSKLNLTTEQKEKIKAIRTQTHANLKANRTKVWAIQRELSTLIHSDKMDTRKVDALINEKAQLKAQIQKSRAVMQNEIYNVLNSKQKAELQSAKQQWFEKHHNRF